MFCPNCGKEVSSSDRFCPHCGFKLDGVVSQVQEKQADSSGFVDIDNIEQYATPLQRLGAYILDMVIFYFSLIFLFIVMGFLGILTERTLAENGDAINLMGIILAWLYYALQESSARQATLGQRALKIKVVDYNFERISFARATGRHFAMILSVLILFIGVIMIFFTKRRQTLHDIIAGTLVIKG